VFAPPAFVSPLRLRLWLAATLAACLAATLVVLRTTSAANVRQSDYHILGYELVAGLWLGFGLHIFKYFGVSLRDDFVERRNTGAGWAIGGASIGLTACYVGGNVGEGPGSPAVAFSGVLASAAFFSLWLIAEYAASRWSEAITVDRDAASGVRLGGFLAASGLVFGSATAGNWVSLGDIASDFVVRSWPIVPVAALALAVERLWRESHSALVARFIAAGYVGLALALCALEWSMR
jgi:hypothetical protein